MTSIHETLKKHFGYDTFRPGQEKIITTLLSGRDVLGIMPTGAGKSLCYQIPALLFPGITLVVSPLISLMQDQVDALRRRGIPAEYINSAVPPARQRAILSSFSESSSSASTDPHPLHFSSSENSPSSVSAVPCLLYVSPERLSLPGFRDFMCKIRISFLCVDEAHCISLWGQQFRPDYLKIADFVGSLPSRPVIGAFTATANAEVRDDIISRLELRSPYVLTTGFDRPNIFYEVRRNQDKWTSLTQLLTRHRGECGIIYCLTRRTVDALSKKLSLSSFPVTRYHAGMSLESRETALKDWLSGRQDVIVATNAFGMGIDKPDVRFVIHYNMPGCMENYYQESGRAGRDGLPSECVLLYNYRDVVINRYFISRSGTLPAEMVRESGHQSVSSIEDVYVALDDTVDLNELRAHERVKLSAMQRYAAGDVCLRAFILDYFGEKAAPYCGRCSRCLSLLPFGKHYTALIPDRESEELYTELRALRQRLARRYGILPHRIFTNRTLHDFARARPVSIPAMLLIEGAGIRSCLRYGRFFAEEIRIFVNTN